MLQSIHPKNKLKCRWEVKNKDWGAGLTRSFRGWKSEPMFIPSQQAAAYLCESSSIQSFFLQLRPAAHGGCYYDLLLFTTLLLFLNPQIEKSSVYPPIYLFQSPRSLDVYPSVSLIPLSLSLSHPSLPPSRVLEPFFFLLNVNQKWNS